MSTLTSVSGFPRIGQNRELKKIIEGYWKGANDLAAVKATAAELPDGSAAVRCFSDSGGASCDWGHIELKDKQ